MPTTSGYNPTVPIGLPYGASGPATLPFGNPTSPTGGSGLPGSGFGSVGNQFSQFGVGDILGAIGGAVGDVGGWIADHIPRSLIPAGAVDSSGNINWAAVGVDAIKNIAGWLNDNKATILDGLNVVNQYQRSQQSDKYAKEALDLAKERYDSQAPLRTAGQAGMLAPGAIGANTAALTKQGQNGLQLAAPQPVRAPTLNLANAQTLATGGGANPFTKSLPQAPIGLPLGTAPGNPGNPGAPGASGPTPPTAPTQPTALTAPLGIAPTPAQLEGPHIPSPFSDIPDGFGVTRKPGQLIKPLPLATR